MTDERRNYLLGTIAELMSHLTVAKALAKHLTVEADRTANQLAEQKRAVEFWRKGIQKYETELMQGATK